MLTATPPRALLVTFNRLVPADQGNARRIHQVLRIYRSLGWEVDLLYHEEEGIDVGLSAALLAQFGRVLVLPSRAKRTIERPGHICRVADWFDPGLLPAARDLHRLRGYRLVHVNYVWNAPLFAAFGPGVIKVLDTHDVFTDRAQRYRDAGLAPQWFSTTAEEEDAGLAQADTVLAIQREEGEAFAARGHRHVHYLPYVEPLARQFFAPRPAGRPLTLGYLGSGNDWNIRSLDRFLAQWTPAPSPRGALLRVAGGVCRHLLAAPGVTLLGYVAALEDFYDTIDIAINPMVGGSGLKIKTVEPLTYGKPVLTTPAGAQGLTHLWRLPVVADAAEMAAHLATYADGRALTDLREAGRASRAALDAEYTAQRAAFTRWLATRG
ncbi:MAG: glycosyltransferase [Proteobacteria bacterium]|nr:glycosyltransferase [Pseudomonadota bacterium]